MIAWTPPPTVNTTESATAAAVFTPGVSATRFSAAGSMDVIVVRLLIT